MRMSSFGFALDNLQKHDMGNNKMAVATLDNADLSTINKKDDQDQAMKQTHLTDNVAVAKESVDSIAAKQFWEDIQGLHLNTSLDLKDVNVQAGLNNNAIMKTKEFISSINQSKIYNVADNECYIHALCLIANVTIDYKAIVPAEHLSNMLPNMLRDAIFMVLSETVTEAVIKQWKECGKEMVKAITTF